MKCWLMDATQCILFLSYKKCGKLSSRASRGKRPSRERGMNRGSLGISFQSPLSFWSPPRIAGSRNEFAAKKIYIIYSEKLRILSISINFIKWSMNAAVKMKIKKTSLLQSNLCRYKIVLFLDSKNLSELFCSSNSVW